MLTFLATAPPRAARGGRRLACTAMWLASVTGCGRRALTTQPPEPPVRAYSESGTYYEIAGPPGAPVVVLLHASGVDLRLWDRESELLRPRHRVLRYDLRAHGRTRAAPAPVPPFEDLRELLDELRLGRVSLVGLSMGASIAADFAIAYPGRVSRLVLASPSLGGYVPTERPPWLAAVARAARAGDPARAAALFADSPLMAVDAPGTAASANGRRLRALILENARAWSDTSRPARALTPPAIRRLGEIAAESLVLVGGRDARDVLLTADTIARGVRGARLVVVPGAGHVLNLAAPDRFGAEVGAFLARPPGGRPVR